jgi:recombination protein RecT
MAVDQSQLKNQLANQTGGAPAKPASPANTVKAYLEKMGPEIAKALPKHMDADRLARVALTTIRTNQKLLDCSIESLMGAVMQAAQLGLEPNMIGHCYIIPYGKEAQFQIGYRGMIDLARRSGNILSISAHEVYENDWLKLQYGLEDKCEHVPWHLRDDKKFNEPGAFKGAYMVAKFRDGGHQIHYMPRAEIDQHRDRSQGYKTAIKYNRTDNPWISDYNEMAKKTVVRSAWKWLPISIELMKAVEQDETVKKEIAEDMSEVVDISGQVVAEEISTGMAESAAGSESKMTIDEVVDQIK